MDGSDVEAVVVDRKDHERGLQPSGAHRVRGERRVLSDEPQADVRIPLAEVDRPGPR